MRSTKKNHTTHHGDTETVEVGHANVGQLFASDKSKLLDGHLVQANFPHPMHGGHTGEKDICKD
jgi:hypothetical protein